MRIAVVLAAMVAALVLAARAVACACCAERGEWHQYPARVGDAEMTELERLRPGNRAFLVVGPAGLAGVRGIEAPARVYSLAVARRGRGWALALRDARGGSGTLAFRIPPSGVSYAADLGDGRKHRAGGPLLYKEWRLDGRVFGTGVFARGSAGARFRLVLQGRGNNCPNAADFRRWIIQVAGPRARYSLYGALLRPTPA
jgi:hypothetical protein